MQDILIRAELRDRQALQRRILLGFLIFTRNSRGSSSSRWQWQIDAQCQNASTRKHDGKYRLRRSESNRGRRWTLLEPHRILLPGGIFGNKAGLRIPVT